MIVKRGENNIDAGAAAVAATDTAAKVAAARTSPEDGTDIA